MEKGGKTTFTGNNSDIFISVFFLLKQILSLKSQPKFGKTSSSREATRKSQHLFPFVEKCLSTHPT